MAYYKVIWKQDAWNNLKKLSYPIALGLKERVDNYLVQDPYGIGKPLKGKKYKGCYRYRYQGNYRVIYIIDKANNTIFITDAGHRKEVY